ncbi:hypothetical protein MMC28_010404 [Mycoblastus sanguinarius]|nr:hypothetical protein [Mycoblastus sanguinarius]
MGATNPRAQVNPSSKLLSRIRDGGISKSSKATGKWAKSIIDLTENGAEESQDEEADSVEEADSIEGKPKEQMKGELVEVVYKVMKTHTDPYCGPGIPHMIAEYATLESANQAARSWLRNEFGKDLEWNEYAQTFTEDGRVKVSANGFESEQFEIWIELKMQSWNFHTMEPDSLKRVDEAFAYVVMQTHRLNEINEDETQVIAVCSDLADANQTARRCLKDQFGSGMWDEYDEDVTQDGRVEVNAHGFEDEDFHIWIEKKAQKSGTGPSKPETTKVDGSLVVYVVTRERRTNVCGSNEEGEIECVDIEGVFKDLTFANACVRRPAEQNEEDGEYEIDERVEDGGRLQMEMRDMIEGTMFRFGVVQQVLR